MSTILNNEVGSTSNVRKSSHFNVNGTLASTPGTVGSLTTEACRVKSLLSLFFFLIAMGVGMAQNATISDLVTDSFKIALGCSI